MTHHACQLFQTFPISVLLCYHFFQWDKLRVAIKCLIFRWRWAIFPTENYTKCQRSEGCIFSMMTRTSKNDEGPPNTGHVTRMFHQYLLQVVCDNNEQLFDYVENCLAYMVQHPAQQLEVIPVFLGETQKTHALMRGIFPSHCALQLEHDIDYNNDASLVLANNMTWAQYLDREPTIKSTVSDPHYGKSLVICTTDAAFVQGSLTRRRLLLFHASCSSSKDTASATLLRRKGGQYRKYLLQQHRLPVNWTPILQVPSAQLD